MSRRPEVGIIGLGLAGLQTARLLEDAGMTVALFEAGETPGGRARTAEAEDGTVYAAGAEWVDADHRRMRALAATLGLDLLPAPLDADAVVLRDGERRSLSDLWEDAGRDAAAVESAAEDLCRRLGTPPWSGALARRLDRRSLAEFLDEVARSDSGRFWVRSVYRSDEGDEPERVGLLGWLLGFTHYRGRKGHENGAYRLPEGGAELCRRMLAGLRAEPRFGSTLVAVEQAGAAVLLRFEGFTAEVDRAVLTMPPLCVRDVDFDPQPDPRRVAALGAVGSGRGLKLALRFETAWWRERGLSGRMHGEGILQDVWSAARSDPAILHVYVCGEPAATLARAADPPATVLGELARYFPEAKRAYRRGWTHDWTADTRARGVHSHFPPGYVVDHFRNVARPEGRVHFAGEHTSSWNGFLEGALESAARVSAELCERGDERVSA